MLMRLFEWFDSAFSFAKLPHENADGIMRVISSACLFAKLPNENADGITRVIWFSIFICQTTSWKCWWSHASNLVSIFICQSTSWISIRFISASCAPFLSSSSRWCWWIRFRVMKSAYDWKERSVSLSKGSLWTCVRSDAFAIPSCWNRHPHMVPRRNTVVLIIDIDGQDQGWTVPVAKADTEMEMKPEIIYWDERWERSACEKDRCICHYKMN